MKKRLIISLIVFIAAVAVLTTLCILVRKNNLDPLGVDVWARDLAYNTRGEKGGLNYWFWRIFTEAGDLYVLAVLCVVMLIYTKLDYRFMIFLGSKPVLSPTTYVTTRPNAVTPAVFTPSQILSRLSAR